MRTLSFKGGASPITTPIYTVPEGKVATITDWFVNNTNPEDNVTEINVQIAGTKQFVGKSLEGQSKYYECVKQYNLVAGDTIVITSNNSSGIQYMMSGVEEELSDILGKPISLKGQTPTTLTTLYTVPQGKRCVLFDVNVNNASIHNADVILEIGGISIYPGYRLPTCSKFVEERQSIELNAGDTIKIKSDISDIYYYISGLEEDLAEVVL